MEVPEDEQQDSQTKWVEKMMLVTSCDCSHQLLPAQPDSVLCSSHNGVLQGLDPHDQTRIPSRPKRLVNDASTWGSNQFKDVGM